MDLDGWEPQEIEAFIQGLFAIAWADGDIQREEREKLVALLERLAIAGEPREKAERWFTEPVLLENVPWSEIPLKGRVLLYGNAVEIARVDGVVQPSEGCALGYLSKEIKLPPKAMAAIERGEDVPPELLER